MSQSQCINNYDDILKRCKQQILSNEESPIFGVNRKLFSDALLFMSLTKEFYQVTYQKYKDLLSYLFKMESAGVR